VLALLSKTAVAPLPVVLLGLAWWRRGRVTSKDMWRSAPFFAAALLLGLITVWFEHHRISALVVREDSFWSRLAVAGWAVWFYLYKALLPVNLIFVYPRWQVDPSKALSYVPGALVAGALLLLWCYRRRWGRTWLFCAGYYVVLLLPILGFANIGFMSYSLVADHWQYFSIIAPIAVVSAWFSSRFKVSASSPGSALSPSGLLLAIVLLLTLGSLTWRQSALYANSEILWEATVAANSDCWVAHNNLGQLLFAKGQVEEALVHYRKAVELQPLSSEAHNNLASALRLTGRMDEALGHYRRALELQPDLAMAHHNLGEVLLQKGQTEEGVAHLEKALALNPSDAAARNSLGLALAKQGQLEPAVKQFEAALQIRPDFAEAHHNLGSAFRQQGQLEKALAHYQKAAELRPGMAQIRYNLANVLARMGRAREACLSYEQALAIQPGLAEARNELGGLLFQQGRTSEAVGQFQKAIELRPDYAPACASLAWVLATSPEPSVRNGVKAVELALKAEQLSGGNNPLVLRTLAAAYAESGQYPEAIESAQRAEQLALGQTNTALAQRLGQQLTLYRTGSPYRDTGRTGN
jgi:tetratricopeptide (TPR) repeat protein